MYLQKIDLNKADISPSFLRFFQNVAVMQTNRENNCFLSLKNQKENFQDNSTVRLANQGKKELVNISNVILDKVKKNIQENLQFNK